MKTVTIEQDITFEAPVKDVYEAILDAKKHAAFTQSEVHISDKEGEDFTAYDGYIEGKNYELIPHSKIVQIWKAMEAEWPDEHYSVIEFHLKAKDETTHLHFIHKDLPELVSDSIANGWYEHYWEPMKDYLASHKS
jgi:activator of HSP90 ATPase